MSAVSPPGRADHPAAPELRYVTTASIRVGPPVDLLPAAQGHRRLVAILGGRVEGPVLSGEVMPGGQDNQVLWTSTLTELRAQYALRLDDGALIYVDNQGVRTGSQEDMAALAQGLPVDPRRIYFRTAPRLSSAAPQWAWLERALFIGVGTREPDRIRLDIFEVL